MGSEVQGGGGSRGGIGGDVGGGGGGGSGGGMKRTEPTPPVHQNTRVSKAKFLPPNQRVERGDDKPAPAMRSRPVQSAAVLPSKTVDLTGSNEEDYLSAVDHHLPAEERELAEAIAESVVTWQSGLANSDVDADINSGMISKKAIAASLTVDDLTTMDSDDEDDPDTYQNGGCRVTGILAFLVVNNYSNKDFFSITV